jgi:hypothetical protein
MKNLILAFLLIQFSATVFGQTKKDIVVESGHALIDKVDRQGMQVSIALDQRTITKLWEKKLKEYGKVETDKNNYILRGATIPGISTPCTIFSTILSDKSGTIVFWAIDLGGSYITSGHTHYRTAEGKLKEFATQAYVADVNDQIKTAEGALNSSVRAQQKCIRDGENIQKNIAKNKQEKIDLENKLKENAADLIQLGKDTETNAKNKQDSDKEVEKMTKALEVVKLKLKSFE